MIQLNKTMKLSEILTEAPIASNDDPNDPTIYGHDNANMMTLKGRIANARAQLRDLADMAESDALIVWERITRLHKGGLFMGLAQNLEQVRYGIEQLAIKRKQGGPGSKDIDANIGESKDPCWKDYKQVGMKKKGNRQVPNCVKK